VPQLIEYIALVRQNPYFETFECWFRRNIDDFRYAAHKALDCLVDRKVGARAVELPAGKTNMFSKLINSIKRRLWCRIVV